MQQGKRLDTSDRRRLCDCNPKQHPSRSMPSHASPVCTACGATGQDNLTCIWREKFPCLPVSTVLACEHCVNQSKWSVLTDTNRWRRARTTRACLCNKCYRKHSDENRICAVCGSTGWCWPPELRAKAELCQSLLSHISNLEQKCTASHSNMYRTCTAVTSDTYVDPSKPVCQ